jgi:glycosyltransferase involved in cell wall biosynthesis
MRILLTANASYVPPRGGASRSNLIWLDRLARRGHACRIVCGPSQPAAHLEHHESIEVIAVNEPARRVAALRTHIAEWQPDWVLVSSEDLGHGLLREAHRSATGRVVYLAHTPQFFPFGPASWNPNPAAEALVKQSAAIVAIGQYVADYVRQVLSCEAVVVHPPIYGQGPFACYDNFDRGVVAMFNPCAVKGISLFTETARRLPQYRFGAVPGWGTTTDDRCALEELPNFEFLPPAPSIEDLLARMRLLLMPSLWHEGFGLTVMEAMLRGIPVVTSDSGGLGEATQGAGCVIPVRTIDRYLPAYDDQGMPRPVMPQNDAGPWVDAVRKLLSDRAAYQRESEAARTAALRFVTHVDEGEFERLLLNLKASKADERTAGPPRATVESLSPEKRAWLLERLRKRGAVD